MRTFLPAFLERAFPRVFSAVLMLLVAAYTNPYQVGIYSWVALVYTATVAALDSPARQVIVRAITEPGGMRFLSRYQKIYPAIAFVVITGAIAILWGVGVIPNWGTALDLMPFAVAPVFTSWGLSYVGLLQTTNRWHELARAQLIASVVSVGLALPVLLLTHNLLGPSLQTLVGEIVFAYWCRRRARFQRRAEQNVPDRIVPPDDAKSITYDMVGMAAYSLLAWVQGQAERLFIGAFSGAALLGTFSTAANVGRAPGDALGASTANLTRTAIAPHFEPKAVRETSEKLMLKTLALAFGAPLSATAFALLIGPLLGADWKPAMRVVPILSISAFPSVMSWAASVLQMKAGRANRAVWAPILGIAFGALIGLTAAHSLALACYFVIVREVAVVTLAFTLVRSYAPWRAYAVCMGIVAALTTVCLFVIGW